MSANSTANPVSPHSPNLQYAHVAADASLTAAVEALGRRGISATVVDTAAEAKDAVLRMLPPGAEVFTASSRTLDVVGLTEAINAPGRFDALRPKLFAMDRAKQATEMRKLAAAPDYVVGSVQAVTEQGEVLVASATGSQLGPYAAAAGHVIWVVGAQKIVPSLEEAFRRVEEYSYPLEDARARQVYGQPSLIGKLLVVEREIVPGRIHLIIVRESLGF
jgi:hypothetical protein